MDLEKWIAPHDIFAAVIKGWWIGNIANMYIYLDTRIYIYIYKYTHIYL